MVQAEDARVQERAPQRGERGAWPEARAYRCPRGDQTTKKPTLAGWPFYLQINDLPESDVERAMGIENVEQGMKRRLWAVTIVCG